MAGQGQLPFALHNRGFDVQDVSPGFRPGQAGRDADFIFFLFGFRQEFRHAEILVQIGGLIGNPTSFPFRDLLRHLPHDIGDFPLEISHARFARVVRLMIWRNAGSVIRICFP